MAYAPDRTKHVEHQLLDATEYLIANGITVAGAGGSVTINADVIDVDMDAITGSAAGVGGSSLDDVNTTLGSPAQAGEAAAGCGLVVTALGSVAQAGEAAAGCGLIVTALGTVAQAGEAGTAAGTVVSALGTPAQAGEAAAAITGLENDLQTMFDLFTGGGSDFIGMPELKANLDTKLDTLHADLAALSAGVGTLLSFDVLAGPNEATVDNTATGKTLATLLGVALNAGLRRLTLIVQGTISWAAGSAVVGVNDLVPGLYTLDVSKAVGDTFKFIASADTKMTVVQEG